MFVLCNLLTTFHAKVKELDYKISAIYVMFSHDLEKQFIFLII